jgi:4a-hydroxytetrahydrobiopterin dehydratase
MSARLDKVAITEKIAALPDWETDGKALHRTKTFKDFVEAIAFVNQLVSPAEALGHHPDISISYNKVKITLTTHDAGGLTELDFQLAQTISNLV